MIKFFRKIRLKLLQQNKVTQYLVYAICEIMLIVIGIMIAFQVNNWNEERKANVENAKFLNNLRQEIEQDTAAIGSLKRYYERINQNLTTTSHLLNSKTDINEEDRKTISASFIGMQVLTPLYKNIGKNNTKLADGTLLNINNELNKKYQNYIENIEHTREIYNKLGESLQLIAIRDVHPNVNLIYTKGEALNAEFDIDKIRENQLIKNALVKSIKWRINYVEWMKVQKEQADELMKILEEELKKPKYKKGIS